MIWRAFFFIRLLKTYSFIWDFSFDIKFNFHLCYFHSGFSFWITTIWKRFKVWSWPTLRTMSLHFLWRSEFIFFVSFWNKIRSFNTNHWITIFKQVKVQLSELTQIIIIKKYLFVSKQFHFLFFIWLTILKQSLVKRV